MRRGGKGLGALQSRPAMAIEWRTPCKVSQHYTQSVAHLQPNVRHQADLSVLTTQCNLHPILGVELYYIVVPCHVGEK